MTESKLTPKQQRFIEEYLIDLNATQAAIRAGYSAKTANPAAARLLANVSIQIAIAKGIEARSERIEITQDRVLQEIAKLAFGDERYNKLRALDLLARHLGLTGKDNSELLNQALTVIVQRFSDEEKK